jgi:mitochondrial FAD-linked sulfhydryl oxidase
MSLERWIWPPLAKNEWGPRGWNWLHTVACQYPAKPTSANVRMTSQRIWNFINHLPCAECRVHATEYIRGHPPTLESTYSLQSWAWTFHNYVNRRLGKPTISYDEYQKLYSDEICNANTPIHRYIRMR